MEKRTKLTLDNAVFRSNIRIQRPLVRGRGMEDIVMYRRVVPVFSAKPRQHVVKEMVQDIVVQNKAIHKAAASDFVQHVKTSNAGLSWPAHSTDIIDGTTTRQELKNNVVQVDKKRPTQARGSMVRPSKEIVPNVSKVSLFSDTHKSNPFTRAVRNIKVRGIMSNAYMGIAIIMIVAGALVLFKYHKATDLLVSGQAQAQGNASPSVAGTDEFAQSDIPDVSDGTIKDEKPVPASYVHKVVNPDIAHSVSIPSLGIFGYIKTVGITKNGAMATPSSIYWGGWSSTGSAPGKSGLAVLNGHVSGPTSKGIFYKLNKIAIGSVINIKKGDGTTIAFKVLAKESVSVESANTKLYEMRGTSESQLNIITCDGKFEDSTDSFKNRLIVYTEKI